MNRADVETALEIMRGLFPETPLQYNQHLSSRFGADIWLKREDLTPVRSYKIRGAFNFMRKVIGRGGQGRTTFVCASAGNHAQGFAFVCRHFGVEGVVFMPVTTPQQKIEKTRIFGGGTIEIRLVGDIFDQCYAAARTFVEETGGHMVPPFDHDDIIEGQATVAAEIMTQLPGDVVPDLVLMPVGGGGLSAGMTGYLDGIVKDESFLLVEPAGALSVAALDRLGAARLKGKTVVCVVSGGNFDFERLPDVKERAMRFSGVKKYFVLRLPQRPGALRDFLQLLGPNDDIARFEYLKKSARNFGSVLLGIETTAPENFVGLFKRIDAAGLTYEDITENEVLGNFLI